MKLARSKLTAQGQISVPANVRQRLGVGPGSVLEWDEEGDEVVVRRAKLYTSEELHKAVFPEPPAPKSLDEIEESIGQYMKKKYAKR